MRSKPLLNFWQLWNMSFGYIGIQFGFALQNSNLSRIFETLGARQDDIPALWIAAPLSGLIVQPIIGYMSDRTWNRLGRRKPYFLSGAILASLALLVMPNSPTLWVAAGMLWMLDASINVTMEPMRAFVGDMLSDEQRTQGFAVQTFFIGAASIVGSLLPYILTNWLKIPNTAEVGLIPPSVRWAFYVGGIIYISAVLWTIFTTKEYSPAEMEAFSAHETNPAAKEQNELTLNTGKYNASGFVLLSAGLILTYLVKHFAWDRALYILSFGIAVYGALQLTAAQLFKSGMKRGLVEIIYDLNNMPGTMRQLAVVTMFTWFAMFAWFIYCTPAITSFHYGTSDPLTKQYNEGADWVGVLNSVYNGMAALVAFILPVIAKKTSRVTTHVFCLFVGGLGMMSLHLFKNPHLLVISMAGLGIAWAGLLTMPYAILSSVVPHRKMGVYMGMFNFFIVIPQILAAATMGLMLRHWFEGHAIKMMVLGGVSMIVAGVLMMFVKDNGREGSVIQHEQTLVGQHQSIHQ
ncbi:MFS transporter [Pedosphaera parvula]|uniref:Major facilitator superfamily MFS_1 n=1 Tax=Pedosphaera parvula (strain Ellin514) TaxID=320771 RepID=B9XHM9_PEDPL|nr:MFS transporter [Pedosphaera parvula]EEF60607.1 major facilitator superfamily MFS_1 [Pedosphaera parvula Ellin514]